MTTSDANYTIVSSDSHAGADLLGDAVHAGWCAQKSLARIDARSSGRNAPGLRHPTRFDQIQSLARHIDREPARRLLADYLQQSFPRTPRLSIAGHH